MFDQADNLRKKMKSPRVVSVVSGKGGVGKSNLSLNFALALKKLGKKVILFDLDIGMANLDILMGLIPARTIVDMVEEKLSIWEIIEHGTGGLSFIAGGSGLKDVFRMDEQKTAHFLHELGSLQKEYDTVIFDMGAGISDDLLKFVLASDEMIVVTTPEPTAMTDAYAAMKFISRMGEQLPVRVVVNRSRSEKEGRETAIRLQRVAGHFLNQKIRAFSVLPDDSTVPNAVKAGIPFLLYAPRAPVTKAVLEAARAWSGLPPSGGGFLRKLRSYFSSGKERIL